MKIDNFNKPDETVTEFLKECFPLIDEFDHPAIKEMASNNSILAQFAIMGRDEGFLKLLEQTKSNSEIKVMMTAALLKNVHTYQTRVRKNLQQKHRNHKKLLNHDFFKDHVTREIELGMEIEKIKQSASKDAYYAILKLLDDYYSEVNPDISQRERFASIYDKLSLLKPDPEQHFYTPEEVKKLLNRDSVPSEADIVTFKYDEIKRDIWKAQKS